MKYQAYAIFVFIGVVTLTAGFIGAVGDNSSAGSVVFSDKAFVSNTAPASALLAVRDTPTKERNVFGQIYDFFSGPAPEESYPPQPVVEAVPESRPLPTICNVFITQPVFEPLANSFVVSGYIDQVSNPECRWTVFEANAGGIEIYDDAGNLLSDYMILNSIGDWMQLPSYFQSLAQMTEVPQTEYGYIRFYEHTADDSVPDIFDYPIHFSSWGNAPRTGFLDAVTSFFTNNNNDAPRPLPIKDTSSDPGRGTGVFVGTARPVPTTPVTEFDSVPLVDSSDDNYCEVRENTSLVCYGTYSKEDGSVCGCTTFPALLTMRAQSDLNTYNANLEGVTFDTLLFIGDRGDTVRSVQEALYILGYYDQIPGGIFDMKTVRALRAFQKENNISGWGIFFGKESQEIMNRLFSN